MIYWIIFIIVLFVFIWFTKYCIDCYESELPISKDAVQITFDNFYQWYTLNPKRWILGKGCVQVRTKEYKTTRPYMISSPYRDCYFNLKDWKKYKKFKNKLDKIETNKKVNKATIEILEAVQQDIDALRKQSNQEIKEANDRAIEIAERLNKK